HGVAVSLHARPQTTSYCKPDHEQARSSPVGPLAQREPVFQPAAVIDEPLLDGTVPGISDTLILRSDPGGRCDNALPAGIAVALECQSPFPAAMVRLDREAAAIEPRQPLLGDLAGCGNAHRCHEVHEQTKFSHLDSSLTRYYAMRISSSC